MLVLAHRGYHQQAPENTLEAFAAAEALGVDGIETDLRLSADGEVILFHDRLAPDGREVAELTRDELSRLAGYPVPTAGQALNAHPLLLWNLEIKLPAVVAAAVPILREYADRRRLLVTSFWHNAIVDLLKKVDVPCGLLEADRPLELSPLVPTSSAAGKDSLAPSPKLARRVSTIVWSFEMIDPQLLAAARAQGVANWAYGLHTPADHRRAAELQLNAVITDRPEWVDSPEN